MFLGKQKVQVTFKDFIFVVGSVLRTGSAQPLCLQYFTAVPISNIAELVPSGFFCPQPWFLRRSQHIFRIKTLTCVTHITSNRIEVHRLNSQHLAMVRTSNMAELVPSGIFCLQPWSLQRTEPFPYVFMSIQLYFNNLAQEAW